jgi:hypothetical protein
MVVDKTEFHGAGTWFKPTTLVGLLKLLKEFGDPVGGGYKIVVGNTEVGIGKHLKEVTGVATFCTAELTLTALCFLLQRQDSRTRSTLA